MKNSISILLVFLIFIIAFQSTEAGIPESDNYIIDGSDVYIDNDKAYIRAPGEIHGSGWTYLNFTAKQYNGDIDLALGFDTTHLKPKRAEFYKPHLVYQSQTTTFYNVTGYEAHDGSGELDVGEYNVRNNKYFIIEYSQPNYNYSECGPMFENCIPDNYTTETLITAFDSTSLVPSEFEVGENYTIMWYTERIENWIDITNKFSVLPESIHNNYDGKDKWYYVKDQPITAGTEYQIRIFVDAPPQLGEHVYKYDVVIKPSSQSFATANANGNLFVLDPYWNTTFSSRKPITITTDGTSTPANYQVLLNISYESEMQVDFDDIRFTNSSNGTIPYWIESKVNSSHALVWVKLSDAITDPGTDTIWMYYENDDVSDDGDIGDTFILGDDFNDDSIDGSKWDVITSTNTYTEANGIFTIKRVSDAGYSSALLSNATFTRPFILEFDYEIANSANLFGVHDNTLLPSHTNLVYGTHHSLTTFQAVYEDGNNRGEQGSHQKNTLYNFKYIVKTTGCDYIRDGNSYYSSSYSTEDNLKAGFTLSGVGSDEYFIDNVKVRKYIANEPTPAYGTAQYYVDSLHYNATISYNHTIESDGTITSNRSIIPADNTNDTAQSTGTSYLTINNFDNDATIVRNFTFTGDNLDWYQAANLSGSYDLKNVSGIIETQTNGNFTTNLVAGTYWIEEEEIPTYIPPNPTSLASTTGNFWVNHTYVAGSGNVTDSFNISVNDVWYNTTTDLHFNDTYSAHEWQNITVWAYNSSGSGTLSAGSVSDNKQIPNNVPVLSGVSASYNLYENETLTIDADHTDADSDTITYSDNASEWNINPSTGEVSWVLDWEDVAGSPYSYRITIDDGEGGTDYQDFTVTINGMQNTALTSIDTSFENGFPGTDYADNVITLSFYLINSGSIDADISAKFTTDYESTYGLVSGTSTIGGSNFKLGNATLDTLLDNGNSVDLTDDVPGEVTQRNYEVQLRVPSGQSALAYSGTVELTFSDAI